MAVSRLGSGWLDPVVVVLDVASNVAPERVFAVIQPTTQTRVDLGLALKGTEPTQRLEAVKRLGNDRITHRIALTAPKQVDAEVRRWLKQAYLTGG